MRNVLYLTSLHWLQHESGSRLLTQIAHFLLHMLAGTVIFALIAVLAVFVDYATLSLQNLGVDQIVIKSMKGVAYALMIVDTLLLLVFIAVSAVRDFRK